MATAFSAVPAEPAPAEPTNAGYVPEFVAKARHPGVCMATLLPKIGALAMYFIGRYVQSNYVSTFIIVALCLAVDFWITKNIAGRLLVHLRWWNEVKEDGTSHWIFEAGDESTVDKVDRRVFWTSLYVTPAIVVTLFILNLIAFSFDWCVLLGMACSFTVTNLVGFYKCSSDAKKRARDWLGQGAMAAMNRASNM